MTTLVQRMDARLYPDLESNWDDALFREVILRYLDPADTVLDLGAGAGIVAQMNFRGLARRVCGVDPDERVLQNPYLDEARTALGESIPYADETFDLVLADNVLEHLPDPTAVFREIARVLKPGGCFLAKTPNKWHYMPLVARATPHTFHEFINRRRGRDRADTFPTLYRANTSGAVRRHASAAGLRVREFLLVEGRPEYLRFNPLTYLVGWLYERIVNKVAGLSKFRILLVAVLEKPGPGGADG